MRRDHSQQSAAAHRTDSDRQDARAVDEIQRLSEAESDERPSLVDPLSYAPLILVGVVLIFFPEPATTVIGLPCLLAGLLLAVVDGRSSHGDS